MSTTFWIWLSIIVITVIVEIITTDLVSIWFTFGAVIPLFLSAFNVLNPLWQTVIFVVVSAVLISVLRKVTVKFFFKNNNSKTNLDTIIGEKYRLIEGTTFEKLGKIEIKDVTWSVMGENQQSIKKGQVVEVVKIEGNKLIVKPANTKDNKQENKTTNKE
jgi:membrane protein implicated in regulation of membrane protease activity